MKFPPKSRFYSKFTQKLDFSQNLGKITIAVEFWKLSKNLDFSHYFRNMSISARKMIIIKHSKYCNVWYFCIFVLIVRLLFNNVDECSGNHSDKCSGNYWVHTSPREPRSINPPVTRRGVVGVTGRSWIFVEARILAERSNSSICDDFTRYSPLNW